MNFVTKNNTATQKNMQEVSATINVASGEHISVNRYLGILELYCPITWVSDNYI